VVLVLGENDDAGGVRVRLRSRGSSPRVISNGREEGSVHPFPSFPMARARIASLITHFEQSAGMMRYNGVV
jgi:hypothetical protein